MDTCFVFQSNKFIDTHPEYEGDSSPDIPPPGFKLLEELESWLKNNDCEFIARLDKELNWEHSNWFHDFIYKSNPYNLIIQTNFSDNPPMAYYIGVFFKAGCLNSLFGSREKSYKVPSDLLNLIREFVVKKCEGKNIELLTEYIAIDKVLAYPVY